MTAAFRNSREIFRRSRVKARARWVRPVVWAVFWASLAHVTWMGFKAAQVRLQPDAIATGLPGFLFRLVIRPLEWAMQSFHGADPALLTLQAAIMVAICGMTIGLPRQISRTLGGERGTYDASVSRALPGRRETTWN